MKKLFYTLLVLAVALPLIVGVPLMRHSEATEHSDCIAALLSNSTCEPLTMLNTFASHFGAVAKLFTAIPVTNVLSSLLLGLLFLLGAYAPVVAHRTALHELRLRTIRNSRTSHDALLKWLGLHEKRDPAASF